MNQIEPLGMRAARLVPNESITHVDDGDTPSHYIVTPAAMNALVVLAEKGAGHGSTSKRYSSHEQEQAVSMYRAGMSSIEVGKIIGCPSGTVISWVRKCGGEIRPQHPGGRPSPEARAHAISLYADGASMTEAAKEAGVSRSSLDRWVKAAPGVEFRGTRRGKQ